MEKGEKYNKFEVLEVEQRNKVRVRCECGYEGFRRASHLESGRTRMCKSCASKETAASYPPPVKRQAVGLLGKTYYSSLRRGADVRGLEWSVSQEYLWSIFTGKCALTGQEITLSLETHNSAPAYHYFTASLDRIDSSLGYIEGNVQWVHKDINRLKNNYDQEDFIKMCTMVVTYANQQPSLVNDDK